MAYGYKSRVAPETRSVRIVNRDRCRGSWIWRTRRKDCPAARVIVGKMYCSTWFAFCLNPFEIDKEEGLISSVVYFGNPDRTADLGAIFIVLQEGNGWPELNTLACR